VTMVFPAEMRMAASKTTREAAIRLASRSADSTTSIAASHPCQLCHGRRNIIVSSIRRSFLTVMSSNFPVAHSTVSIWKTSSRRVPRAALPALPAWCNILAPLITAPSPFLAVFTVAKRFLYRRLTRKLEAQKKKNFVDWMNHKLEKKHMVDLDIKIFNKCKVIFAYFAQRYSHDADTVNVYFRMLDKLLVSETIKQRNRNRVYWLYSPQFMLRFFFNWHYGIMSKNQTQSISHRRLLVYMEKWVTQSKHFRIHGGAFEMLMEVALRKEPREQAPLIIDKILQVALDQRPTGDDNVDRLARIRGVGTYNMYVLPAWARSGREEAADKIEEHLEVMRQNPWTRPDVHSFAFLLEFYSDSGECERLTEAILYMQKQGWDLPTEFSLSQMQKRAQENAIAEEEKRRELEAEVKERLEVDPMVAIMSRVKGPAKSNRSRSRRQPS
jgi:hypothetical protein